MSRDLVDSGIQWIGKIPSNWKNTKLKRIEKLINGYSFESEKYTDNGYFIVRITNVDDGVLNKNDPKYYPNELKKNFESAILEKNDILMSLTGNVGLVGLVSDEILPAALNQRVGSLRKISDDVIQRYICYLFQTKQFETEAILNSVGTAQLNMSTNWLKELKICLPPLEEQTKIANYLDEKCSKINKIITENKRAIKLLEEYVVSFIDNQYKTNEKTKKIKYNVKVRNEKGKVINGEKYIGLENIEGFTTKYIETNTDNTNSDGKKFYKGDLLINKLRPYLAKSYLAEFDGVCTGEVEVISNYNGNMEYLKYFTISNRYLEIVNASTYGTKMPRANWNFIKELELPDIGTIGENEIVENIKITLTKIDRIIEYRKRIIKKLEEYKKSLIFEVVTGKKEV